jgi:group I intron endonuclease
MIATGDDRRSGLYRIRNTRNGKSYVGSAVVLAERLYSHRRHPDRGTHRNTKLGDAWSKHGADAYVLEILEVVADRSLLIEREQHWIDRLGSYAGGYNLNPTAGSNLGRTFGPETRRRISRAATKAMNDPAVKAFHSSATRDAMQDPAVKRRTAEAARKRWDDPAYRAKLSEIRGADGYEESRLAAARKATQARWEAMTHDERREACLSQRRRAVRPYTVTAPDGSRFVVTGLKSFCSEHGIPYDSAICVVTGRMKSARGYVFEKIGGGPLS